MPKDRTLAALTGSCAAAKSAETSAAEHLSFGLPQKADTAMILQHVADVPNCRLMHCNIAASLDHLVSQCHHRRREVEA
jgi:hypothetical protein